MHRDANIRRPAIGEPRFVPTRDYSDSNTEKSTPSYKTTTDYSNSQHFLSIANSKMMRDRTTYQYNLGSFSRQITTSSPEAQTWFDRGFVWSYAFNHEESARCFERAIDEDANCAMAYWGVSYSYRYQMMWD
jgi:hypothetical protein